MGRYFEDRYDINNPYFKAAYITRKLYMQHRIDKFNHIERTIEELTDLINKWLKEDELDIKFSSSEMKPIMKNLRFMPLFVEIENKLDGTLSYAMEGGDYHNLIENLGTLVSEKNKNEELLR